MRSTVFPFTSLTIKTFSVNCAYSTFLFTKVLMTRKNFFLSWNSTVNKLEQKKLDQNYIFFLQEINRNTT